MFLLNLSGFVRLLVFWLGGFWVGGCLCVGGVGTAEAVDEGVGEGGMDGGELGLPLLPLGGVGDFVLGVVEVVDYHFGVDVNHCVVLAVGEVADDGELGVCCAGCHRFF